MVGKEGESIELIKWHRDNVVRAGGVWTVKNCLTAAHTRAVSGPADVTGGMGTLSNRPGSPGITFKAKAGSQGPGLRGTAAGANMGQKRALHAGEAGLPLMDAHFWPSGLSARTGTAGIQAANFVVNYYKIESTYSPCNKAY